MEASKLFLYEMKFKIAYMEKKGKEFQDFFSEIMEKCHPGNFQRIRPWGNIGDRKNDGYLRLDRTVFQVYAPNELGERKTIEKIDEDFHGALKHWDKYLDKWIFVHNSREGLGPLILKKLLELGASYDTVEVCPWGFEELRQAVFTLDEIDLASLLGYIPSNKDMLDVRYESVQKVLNHIAQQKYPRTQDIRPVPPDKLKFNHLSESAQYLLTLGMRKAGLVESFFRDNPDPQYGDEIATAFNEKYKRYKILHTEPDIIFTKLQDFAGGQEKGDPAYQAAVLAVLACLFEQCDIFERPSNEVI